MALPWWTLLLFMRHSWNVTPNSYNYTDPNKWKDDFPMCGGPMQSPIALTPDRLALSRTPKLEFAKGLASGKVEMINTGREIKLKLRPGGRDEPLLQLVSYSRPMLGFYTFAQMHFHWGDEKMDHGSEHAIGKNFTDAEAHFVFFNNRYGNFKEALKNFDGLLVIGVMLRGTDNMQQFTFPTLGVEKEIKKVAKPGQKRKIRADLSGFEPLLRRAVSQFYSYHGSLTTPPCNPVVTWMVSAKSVAISNAFLHNLRTAVYEDDDESDLLVNNFRPVQAQLGRIVTKHISIG